MAQKLRGLSSLYTRFWTRDARFRLEYGPHSAVLDSILRHVVTVSDTVSLSPFVSPGL